MSRFDILIFGILGLVVCWALIPLIVRRSIWLGGLQAEKQFHQTHTTPIPRLGGLALAAAFLLVAVLALIRLRTVDQGRGEWSTILLGGIAMFIVGFCDDLRPMPAKLKLLLQILVAGAVWYDGIGIDKFQNPITKTMYDLHGFGPLITIFWLVAVTNLINLVDGIDGLAGGIGFMLMCLLAYVGWQSGSHFQVIIAVGMAGALLGFLFFNFPPARIYMGDGGAYLVGFLIGVLAISSSHKGTVILALVAPMFALAVPIADVALAILRRGMKGLPIFRPDKKHIHHKIAQFGFSPTRTVLILYGLTLMFLLMGLSIYWSEGQLLPVFIAVGFIILVVGVRSIGWVKDWLTLRHVIGTSVSIRRAARNALTSAQWIEMRAENVATLEELWRDYEFFLSRMGFFQVKLCVDGLESQWQSASLASDQVDLMDRHQLTSGQSAFLEFSGSSQSTPPKIFFLLTELASEGWVKAVARWRELHPDPAEASNGPVKPALPSESADAAS